MLEFQKSVVNILPLTLAPGSGYTVKIRKSNLKQLGANYNKTSRMHILNTSYIALIYHKDIRLKLLFIGLTMHFKPIFLFPLFASEYDVSC